MITVDTDARGVARLTLARADKHNALNPAMLAELEDAARALAAREDVRVVVLAAEGKSFCAGGDLDWFRAQGNTVVEVDRGPFIEAAKPLHNDPDSGATWTKEQYDRLQAL